MRPVSSSPLHRALSRQLSSKGDDTAGRKRKRCLIGGSGSVATLKLPELVVSLSKLYDILIICSKNSLFFLERCETYNAKVWDEFLSIGGWDLVLQDADEWEMWNQIGHDVLHVELRKWADIIVIAPASANLIAKASVGMSDDLLSCVMRAWDFHHKPCLLCPAMNTLMWDHPATQPALNILSSWGWQIIQPAEKLLACKDVGKGAIAKVDDIIAAVHDALTAASTLSISHNIKGDTSIIKSTAKKTTVRDRLRPMWIMLLVPSIALACSFISNKYSHHVSVTRDMMLGYLHPLGQAFFDQFVMKPTSS